MRKLLLAGVAAAAVSTGAQAALTPINAIPVAVGPMTIVFLFKDAADASTLSWNQGAGPAVVVTNQSDPVGTTVNFGAAGPVTFTLENITKGYTFTIGTPVDGEQHFQASGTFAAFGVGALSPAAAAAIAAIGFGGVFVGVEDRRAPDPVDFDFNDLIYYFKSTGISVPGPAGLGLFGLGLLGLAALRRRG
jgi:hypothetical protein